MAVSTRTATFTNADNASFRAWAQAIHDILTNGGWVQTSDTGQINLATALTTAGLDTKVGYEIWRTDEAAGSLVDYYIKIYYGSGATSALRPAVWITIGWGSDGSGNLTGTTSTEQQVTQTANPSGVVATNHSAGDGYLVVGMHTATTQLGFCFSLERTRDTNLDFKNEVMFTYRTANNTWGSRTTSQTSAFGLQSNTNVFLIPANTTTPVAGVAGLGLVFGMAPGPTSPSMCLFGAELSSLGVAQDDINVTIYGVSHTYRIQASGVAGTTINVFGDISEIVVLMRYE